MKCERCRSDLAARQTRFCSRECQYAARREVANPTERMCRICKVSKPINDFPMVRNKSGAVRPLGDCRRCHYDSRNAYRREKRQSDLPWAQRHRTYNRDQRRQWKYGLTTEQYDALLASHDGKCGSCGHPEPAQGKRLAIDHDHRTGQVRGLLCSLCNRALGMLQDDIDRVLALASYLIERESAIEGIRR